MSIAMITRTVIVVAYLVALLVNGQANTMTGGLAAAVIAVWAAPLLRDGLVRGHAPRTVRAAQSSPD